MKPPVLFLVGPTAVGKSKLAIEVARLTDGEIISADSMLIYKGMDIGTAKPSKAERRKIKHHLIDLFVPGRNFSVFEYRKRALKKISEISRRGKLPIIVGGTGLYVRSLLQGLVPQPRENPVLRRQLEKRAASEGLSVLYRELTAAEPRRAAQIKSADKRRIIRALEIHAQKDSKSGDSPAVMESLSDLGFEPVVIGVTKDRPTLYAEIERRVDQMFRKGLVREVKRLAKKPISRTALQAVGYKEVLAALRGDCSMEEAKSLIKLRTRHLAKRQWTWFKREAGIRWVSWASSDGAKDMVQKVIESSGGLKIAGNSI